MKLAEIAAASDSPNAEEQMKKSQNETATVVRSTSNEGVTQRQVIYYDAPNNLEVKKDSIVTLHDEVQQDLNF